ncbi:hypothetical protein GQX74_009362 [Glossina fuscipes]|nr:hypothetical protein GQX74_009362 [Glossina fuscipes]
MLYLLLTTKTIINNLTTDTIQSLVTQATSEPTAKNDVITTVTGTFITPPLISATDPWLTMANSEKHCHKINSMTGYPAEAAKVTVYHHHHKVKQQRNNKPNRCYSLANVAPTLHNSMDDKISLTLRPNLTPKLIHDINPFPSQH